MRRLALIVGSCALAWGCNQAEQRVDLAFSGAAPDCDATLATARGIRVAIDGPARAESRCVEVPSALTVDELASHLRKQPPLFKNLPGGRYSLQLRSFVDTACTALQTTLGDASFELPAKGDQVAIALRCTPADGGPGSDGTPPPDAGSDGGGPRLCLTGGGQCFRLADSDGQQKCAPLGNAAIGSVDSVEIVLRDSSGKEVSRCFDNFDKAATIEELPARLSSWAPFSSLDDGDYTVFFIGHDESCGHGTADRDVLACGHAELTVPSTATPTVSLVCWDEEPKNERGRRDECLGK